MAIFDAKDGARIHITTGILTIEFPDLGTKGMVRTNVSYWATATGEYQVTSDGKRRRLFVDMSEDFGVGRQIWLTDGPTVNTYEPVNDEWPDVID